MHQGMNRKSLLLIERADNFKEDIIGVKELEARQRIGYNKLLLVGGISLIFQIALVYDGINGTT